MALFIIILIVLFGGLVLIIVSDSNDILIKIVGILCILFCAVFIVSLIEDRKPQAIDVYRGKTTLQITYQDSIPVDSVVVFK